MTDFELKPKADTLLNLTVQTWSNVDNIVCNLKLKLKLVADGVESNIKSTVEIPKKEKEEIKSLPIRIEFGLECVGDELREA